MASFKPAHLKSRRDRVRKRKVEKLGDQYLDERIVVDESADFEDVLESNGWQSFDSMELSSEVFEEKEGVESFSQKSSNSEEKVVLDPKVEVIPKGSEIVEGSVELASLLGLDEDLKVVEGNDNVEEALVEKRSKKAELCREVGVRVGKGSKDFESEELREVSSLLETSKQIFYQSESLLQRLELKLASMNSLQNKLEKRHIFQSVVAYVVFCVVISLGMYFALSYRLGYQNIKQQYNAESYKKMQETVQVMPVELEKSQVSAQVSFEVYQLLEQGRLEEGLERFNEVRMSIAHPAELSLLTERIEAIKSQLAESSYREGLEFIREGNLEAARDAFFKSMGYKVEGSYSPSLYFHLASSLFQLGDFEGARRYYQESLRFDLNTDMDATARYQLAYSNEKLGANAEAYAQYEAFLRKYRVHRFSDEAERRMGKLSKFKERN